MKTLTRVRVFCYPMPFNDRFQAVFSPILRQTGNASFSKSIGAFLFGVV